MAVGYIIRFKLKFIYGKRKDWNLNFPVFISVVIDVCVFVGVVV